MRPFLEIDALRKVYPVKDGKKIEVLKSVSLSINRGEIVGLLGINGAGKTTLSSIVATLHPPTSGIIRLEGRSIYDDVIGYRMKLGFCPQKPNVNPYLSLRQSLMYAGAFYGIAKDVVEARVDDLMQRFDLIKYADWMIGKLSGGYKQRFMLVRTVVHHPSLIILDEPTVALDAPVRRYLWDVIAELKKLGMTIILTTHYLEEAEHLADRVCLLHAGKIMLIDTPSNLKTKFAMHNLESVFLALMEELRHD